MGGGEGDVPSSSDGLPNVGNGVADIFVQFHWLSVLFEVSSIFTAKAFGLYPFHMFKTFAD